MSNKSRETHFGTTSETTMFWNDSYCLFLRSAFAEDGLPSSSSFHTFFSFLLLLMRLCVLCTRRKISVQIKEEGFSTMEQLNAGSYSIRERMSHFRIGFYVDSVTSLLLDFVKWPAILVRR